ncbi:hypothetical protein HDV05_005391 [Chytridiales sp. JEL 0842]|nr:hypothetical protein HDV05_005391 [Chytridiales sp. JEL 0842]
MNKRARRPIENEYEAEEELANRRMTVNENWAGGFEDGCESAADRDSMMMMDPELGETAAQVIPPPTTATSSNNSTNLLLPPSQSLYQASFFKGKRKADASCSSPEENHSQDHQDHHPREHHPPPTDLFTMCLTQLYHSLNSSINTHPSAQAEITFLNSLQNPSLSHWRHGLSRIALSEMQRELLGNRMYPRLKEIVSANSNSNDDHATVEGGHTRQEIMMDITHHHQPQHHTAQPPTITGDDLIEISRFIHAIEDSQDLKQLFLSVENSGSSIHEEIVALNVKWKVFHWLVVEMVLEYLAAASECLRRVAVFQFQSFTTLIIYIGFCYTFFLLIETRLSPSTLIGDTYLSRNLKDPLLKWQAIAVLFIDIGNSLGPFLVPYDRLTFKIVGNLQLKVPKATVGALTKFFWRFVFILIVFSTVDLPRASYMVLLQFSGIIGSLLVNQLFLLSMVPYPTRLFLGLKMSLISLTVESFFVFSPMGPMTASYLVDGWGGAVLKAVVTSVSMIISKFIINKYSQLQFSRILQEHKARQNTERRQSKTEAHVNKPKSRAVHPELTEKPPQQPSSDLENTHEAIMTSMVYDDGGAVTRLATAYNNVKTGERRRASSFSSTGRRTTLTSELMKKNGEESVSLAGGEVGSIAEEETTPPNKCGKITIVVPESAEEERAAERVTARSKSATAESISIRQAAQDVAVFYLSASLSILADFAQKGYVNQMVLGRYKRTEEDQVADLGADFDFREEKKIREDIQRKCESHVTSQLADTVSQQTALLLSGMFVYFFTTTDSPFLNFSDGCSRRINLNLSLVITRVVYLFVMQNVTMVAQIVLLEKYWKVNVHRASLSLKPMLAMYGVSGGILVCYTGSAAMVIRGLWPAYDKLLVCDLREYAL